MATRQPGSLRTRLYRETAVGQLTSNVPRAAPSAQAGQVHNGMIGERFQSALHIAVVDQERLVGLVGLSICSRLRRTSR
jgi:hypothetical protein